MKMSGKITIALSVWVLGTVVIFLGFSFIKWDMNPGSWDVWDRMVVAFLSLLLLAVGIGSQTDG